jgi:hypothetical protein
VFSRAIPFEHLGRESDVRVFIARTLAPGEVPPLTVPEVAAAWERKLAEGRAAAAAKVRLGCLSVGPQSGQALLQGAGNGKGDHPLTAFPDCIEYMM